MSACRRGGPIFILKTAFKNINQAQKNKFLSGKLWNLRSSDDRVFDRQSKGPGLDTQRSGSVPFFTEKFLQLPLML